MDGASKRALRRLARSRTEPELIALFETIRAYTNAELTAVAFARAAPKPETLATWVSRTLTPVVAPGSEKAALLVEALGAEAAPWLRKSLSATVTALAKRFGEQALRDATERVLEDMARFAAKEKVK